MTLEGVPSLEGGGGYLVHLHLHTRAMVVGTLLHEQFY